MKKHEKQRKEEEFGLSHTFLSYAPEKASASTFRGSVTVETVLVLPIFLFAILSLIWILEIQTIQASVRSGMQEAGRKYCAKYYDLPYVIPALLESEIVDSIGKNRLESSCIIDGKKGIHCEKSLLDSGSKVLFMKTQYKIRMPFPYFWQYPIACNQELKMKCWTGYAKTGLSGAGSGDVRYVTENGEVYHNDYKCKYLDLTIKQVEKSSISKLRNQSEGKYYPCESCMKNQNEKQRVYITSYGDRYHSTLDCIGLKRTIYTLPLMDVLDMKGCHKCVK